MGFKEFPRPLKVKIGGKLSAITKGLIAPQEVIGKPISVDGVIVGKVVGINETADLFFGKIFDNVLINFVTPSSCSCEIKEGTND